MGSAMVLMAAAMAVDAGWQPLADGGMEYIIQIEPHALESFQAGREIVCEVPPNLGEIRSYRLRVGTAPLPRVEPPAPAESESPLPSELPAERPIDPFLSADSPSGAAAEPLSPRPLTNDGDLPEGGPSAAPRPLPSFADSAAGGEQLAVYDEVESLGQSTPGARAADPAEPKPWMPFTLALAAFFGAFGGMLYTGWIAWDYRRRYQTLLERTLDTRALPAPDTQPFNPAS